MHAAVVVPPRNSESTCRRCRSFQISILSRHSRRSIPISRSTCAAALGTPKGIAIPRMPISCQSHSSYADRQDTLFPAFSTRNGRPSWPNFPSSKSSCREHEDQEPKDPMKSIGTEFSRSTGRFPSPFSADWVPQLRENSRSHLLFRMISTPTGAVLLPLEKSELLSIYQSIIAHQGLFRWALAGGSTPADVSCFAFFCRIPLQRT
jgi:hypothetical protein